MKNQDGDKENVITFPEPNYYGDCPKCYKNDGYMNLGRNHWYVCHQHKVKWFIGSNLFSSWQNENEEKWYKNWQAIGHYKEIKPLQRWTPYVTPGSNDYINPEDIPF